MLLCCSQLIEPALGIAELVLQPEVTAGMVRPGLQHLQATPVIALHQIDVSQNVPNLKRSFWKNLQVSQQQTFCFRPGPIRDGLVHFTPECVELSLIWWLVRHDFTPCHLRSIASLARVAL
ncbi:hypothetical protein SynBMKMC1_00243 [Synechococcus sp. BMK-MC-1]|nr:hypothetical protein SynBMKMC1_00243 [Synechococcus sp. BMK-MC-1]